MLPHFDSCASYHSSYRRRSTTNSALFLFLLFFITVTLLNTCASIQIKQIKQSKQNHRQQQQPNLSSPKSLQPPLSLHQVVNTYLENGGQQTLRRALNLPRNTYYNPLQFFNREDAVYSTTQQPSQSICQGSTARMSDLQILRAMGLHVPGVDDESAIHDSVVARNSAKGCREDAHKTTIPPYGKPLTSEQSRFDIWFSANTPKEVELVVESAVRKWSDKFHSPNVTIRICFSWEAMRLATLGATTTPIFTSGEGFRNLPDNGLYNPALASSLEGDDVIKGDNFHVHMALNLCINWHIDQNRLAPSDRFDLASTVLHELTHGLFFSGTIKVPSGSSERTAQFQQGMPGRFDQFLAVEDDIAVARSCVDGGQLYNAVRSPKLRFLDADTSTNLGLYAPREFAGGSSIYHFNNQTIQEDCRAMKISSADCSDLMTHELKQGYTRRNVGLTTMRVYYAMRSRAKGVKQGGDCVVPDYVGTSASNDDLAKPFVLPAWGIATVSAIAVLGTALVVGVIASTIIARS